MNIQENNSAERSHYIYMWKYPIDMNSGSVFYVGQGKYGKLSKYARAHAIHYQDKKRRKSYAQRVFDKIVRKGSTVVIEIFKDNLTLVEAHAIEQELIAKFGRRDNNTGILCNLTDGGDFNPMHDPEIRRKQLNAVRTEEHRRKRSIGAAEVNSRPDILEQNRINGVKMWENSEFRDKMMKIRNSPEYVERNRRIQSELSGIKILFNGIEYRSKYELARTLGISFQMLTYRLKNNIPLDAAKNYRRVTAPST